MTFYSSKPLTLLSFYILLSRAALLLDGLVVGEDEYVDMLSGLVLEGPIVFCFLSLSK